VFRHRSPQFPASVIPVKQADIFESDDEFYIKCMRCEIMFAYAMVQAKVLGKCK
jgi:uncharacterized C2H2 Zn-finger protein